MRRAKEELKEPTAQFLDGALDTTIGFAQHLDNQTNILVGVSSLIFIFALSRFLDEGREIPFFILAVFSASAALMGLFAIHPPRFMRKRGQEESLMYHKHVMEYPSAEAYAKELAKIADDRDVIIREYAITLYNVSKYYYRPKRLLFHYARNLLIVGMSLAFLAFILESVLFGM